MSNILGLGSLKISWQVTCSLSHSWLQLIWCGYFLAIKVSNWNGLRTSHGIWELFQRTKRKIFEWANKMSDCKYWMSDTYEGNRSDKTKFHFSRFSRGFHALQQSMERVASWTLKNINFPTPWNTFPDWWTFNQSGDRVLRLWTVGSSELSKMRNPVLWK